MVSRRCQSCLWAPSANASQARRQCNLQPALWAPSMCQSKHLQSCLMWPSTPCVQRSSLEYPNIVPPALCRSILNSSNFGTGQNYIRGKMKPRRPAPTDGPAGKPEDDDDGRWASCKAQCACCRVAAHTEEARAAGPVTVPVLIHKVH